MLAFTLDQVKHGLFIKRGKVRARVLGRMFPTTETETGRAAICPPRSANSRQLSTPARPIRRRP